MKIVHFLFIFVLISCNKMKQIKLEINNESFCVYTNKSISDLLINRETLVFLPPFTYFDPNNLNKRYYHYKCLEPLINKLKSKYKIIVIEYFGIGDSGDTTRSRDVDTICDEIKYAMKKININKYFLVPHSISGLYSMYYIQKYKNDIKGLIGIDMTLPNFFLEEITTKEESLKHSLEDGDKVSKAFAHQYDYFWDTAKSLEKFHFPNDMPFYGFISTQCKQGIEQEIKNNTLKTHIEDIYNNQLITNREKQSIEILNGSHYLWIQCSNTMAKRIKQFIEKYKMKNIND